MTPLRLTLFSDGVPLHEHLVNFGPGQRFRFNISQILRDLEIDAAAHVTVEVEQIRAAP